MSWPCREKLLLLWMMVILLPSCGGSGSGRVTDDPAVISNGHSEVVEGNQNSAEIVLTFVAQRSGKISYQTFDLEAVEDSDFLPLSGSYSVQAGKEYAVVVEVLADTRVEADERFGVLLSDENGSEIATLYGKILNDDFPRFSVADAETTEVDFGSSKLIFTVTLSENTIDDFPLHVSTLAQQGIGVAEADQDYTVVDSQITFTRNMLSQDVVVMVVGDSLVEPDEVMTLQVSHSSLVREASGLIRTDDVPGQDGYPTFEINGGKSQTVAESAEEKDAQGYSVYQIPFVVDNNFSGEVSEPFELFYQLRQAENRSEHEAAGVSLAGAEDYDDTPRGVIITPGTSVYQATVRIKDDNELEGTEVVQLQLLNDQGAEFGATSLYIRDNESPRFQVSSADDISDDLAFWEGTGTNRNLEVNIAYQEQTNGAEADYFYVLYTDGKKSDFNDFDSPASETEISRERITISSEMAASIHLPISADSDVEANEVFYLQLLDEFQNELVDENGLPLIYELTIVNDDLPRVSWYQRGIEDVSQPISELVISEGEAAVTLYLQLEDDSGQYASALQHFDVVIAAQVPDSDQLNNCSWVSKTVLTLDEDFSLSNNDALAKGESRIAVTFDINDDELVECDERSIVSASLQSRYGALNSTAGHADLLLTVQNNDTAQVTVNGFSEIEDAASHAFDLSLNAGVTVKLKYKLLFNGTDDNDFSDVQVPKPELDASAGEWHELILAPQNSGLPQAEVALAVERDSLVELNEEVTLLLQFDHVAEDFPVRMSICPVGQSCVDAGQPVDDDYASVAGTLVNDDRLTIWRNESPYIRDGNHISGSETNLSGLQPMSFLVEGMLAANFPPVTISPSTEVCSANKCTTKDKDFQEVAVNLELNPDGSVKPFSVSYFIQDQLVEPEEKGAVSLRLAIDGIADDDRALYISGEMAAQDLRFSYEVNDDDVISPDLTLTNNAGDEPASLSVTETLTLKLNGRIADNVDDLVLVLSAECDNCGNEGQDFNSGLGNSGDDSEVELSAKEGELDRENHFYDMEILSDNVVEPDETITYRLSLKAGSNARYLNSKTGVIDEVSYVIRKNGKLSPAVSLSETEIEEGPGKALTVTIDLGGNRVGSNITDMIFELTSVCSGGCDSHAGSGEDDYSDDVPMSINLAGIPYNPSYKITILNDNLTEPTERFTYKLALASNGNASYLASDIVDKFAISFADFTLKDDDKLKPRVYFRHHSAAAENSEASPELIFKPGGLIADNVVKEDLTFVVVGECSGCGKNVNDDYSESSDAVKRFDYTREKPLLSLVIKDDSVVEPDEEITYTLHLAAGSDSDYLHESVTEAEIATASYTIKNNDLIKPLIEFSKSSGLESDTKLALKLSLSDQEDLTIGDNVENLKMKLVPSCGNGSIGCGSNFDDDDSDSSHVDIDLKGVGHSHDITLKIEDDSVVEPDEIITYTLQLADATGSVYLDKSVTETEVETEIATASYTIKNNDLIKPLIKFSKSSGPESDTELALSLSDQKGLTIGDNVNNLNMKLVPSCGNGSIGCGSNFDDDDSDSSHVDIDLGDDITLKIADDSVVEPDEIITYTLQLADATGSVYLDKSVTETEAEAETEIATASYTIKNNDLIKPLIKFSKSSGPESDTELALSLSDQKGLTIGDNVENLKMKLVPSCDNGSIGCGSNFDDDDSDSSHVDIDLKGVGHSHDITLKIEDDSVVEPDEKITYTLKLADATGSVYLDKSVTETEAETETETETEAEIATASYTIKNNDFVTISYVGGSRAVLESTSETQPLALEVCIPDEGSVSDEAKESDFTARAQELSVLSQGMASGVEERLSSATLGQDYWLSDSNDTSSNSVELKLLKFEFGSDNCYLKELVNFKDDALLERNEWFNINVTQSDLCEGGNCFGYGMPVPASSYESGDFNDEGLFVIVNDDDVISAVDSGLSRCLIINSDVAAVDCDADGNIPLHDAQVVFPERSFTFVTNDGEPVPPIRPVDDGSTPPSIGTEEYPCLHDSNTGYMWAISKEENVPIEVCGYRTDPEGYRWQRPSVADFLNLLDLSTPDAAPLSLNGYFITADECLVDGKWVVDADNGLTYCHNEASPGTVPFGPSDLKTMYVYH
ncbi:Calx-beta domain-containing protein [Bacterioplanoides pacificum]|uniref:Calx-beta domain-containing protein n=1 Tax=Bacterioplanoides pacificum TaxID=1171596 RepID=A0ABV7VRE3_9GAMM